jgi:hypothetical protein
MTLSIMALVLVLLFWASLMLNIIHAECCKNPFMLNVIMLSIIELSVFVTTITISKTRGYLMIKLENPHYCGRCFEAKMGQRACEQKDEHMSLNVEAIKIFTCFFFPIASLSLMH